MNRQAWSRMILTKGYGAYTQQFHLHTICATVYGIIISNAVSLHIYKLIASFLIDAFNNFRFGNREIELYASATYM